MILSLAFGLCACNEEEEEDDAEPTPTPAAEVVSDDESEDEDDEFADSEEEEEELTEEEDEETTEFSSTSGAGMTATQETVEVTSYANNSNGTSILYIERANGERWGFDVNGQPNVGTGDSVLFESELFEFGDVDGAIIAPFPDGVRYGITVSVRTR